MNARGASVGTKKLAARIGLLLIAVVAVTAIANAETCYRDDKGRIVTRRRPGYVEVPCPVPGAPTAAGSPEASAANAAPGAGPAGPDRSPPSRVSPLPRPTLSDYAASVAVPDRWRIVDALGYPEQRVDPYNRNLLKADRPVHGDWFFNLSALSDTVFESRQVPTPVGSQSTTGPGSLDVFGRNRQTLLSQTIATEFVYYKGDTVFQPPDYEFRFAPVFNVNHNRAEELDALYVDPARGRVRNDSFFGVQALFADKHLRNVSERFDFDSLRVGIQPFSSDFRGFLFQDDQLGARLFGTRANNRYQYNLAYFRRIEKDTNSGLNDLTQPLRHDDVLIANLYRQDTLVDGFTAQATIAYNRNREDRGTHYDKNGVLVRPAAAGVESPFHYDVVYLGLNGDGHFGSTNLTSSFYSAIGRAERGLLVPSAVDIRAFFGAAELSRDFDWLRPRLSLLYATGSRHPYGNKATGFDAILENPQFAGADSSYWIRQALPLVGGGGVTLSTRNGVLNDLRSSKDEGQSNFVNPGTLLAGIGADADLLPTLRASVNVNSVYFDDTAVLEALRNQGGIDRHIGYDVSLSLVYRPLMSQNIVARASYARLIPGAGFKALFPNQQPSYVLLNVILAY